jgi:hypothetical protein
LDGRVDYMSTNDIENDVVCGKVKSVSLQETLLF